MAEAADYADSFLARSIAKTRQWIDEPAINKKYQDSDIIGQLELSYIMVINEKNRNAVTPIVGKFEVTVSSATAYVLPYTAGSIEAIYQRGIGAGKVFYSSKSSYNPVGRGVWIEGNVLKLQASGYVNSGATLVVEYIPAGVARLHHGACTINADGDVITFGASPNQGVLDTHHHAYIGSIFRIMNVIGTTVTGNVIQERTITAYDNETREATIEPALATIPTTDDGEILYEIAPAIHKGLDLVVPLHTAYMIALIEGNLARAAGIEKAYVEALRNVRLSAYYSNLQDGGRLRADNFDNRFFR